MEIIYLITFWYLFIGAFGIGIIFIATSTKEDFDDNNINATGMLWVIVFWLPSIIVLTLKKEKK